MKDFFFEDGNLRFKNTISVIVIAIGVLIFSQIPKLLSAHNHADTMQLIDQIKQNSIKSTTLDLSNIDTLKDNVAHNTKILITYNSVNMVLLYGIVILLLVWHITIDPETEGINKFLKKIGLVKGRLGSDSEHTQEYIDFFRKQVSENISDDMSQLYILLINGRGDLANQDSPIYSKLKASNVPTKILLLDPFTKFARERAGFLKERETSHDMWLSYICDFLITMKFIEKLKQSNPNIEAKIYCSRPLYRLYFGENSRVSQWCISQCYLNNKHGYDTPIYIYKSKQNVNADGDKFGALAMQAFTLLWENGFSNHNEISDNKVSPQFLLYAASMLDINITDDQNNIKPLSEISKAYGTKVESLFEEAKIKHKKRYEQYTNGI